MIRSRHLYERAQKAACYIVKYKVTIREAAKVLGASKSTVHTDIHRVKEIDEGLYQQVVNILIQNKKLGVIKGGRHSSYARKLRKYHKIS